MFGSKIRFLRRYYDLTQADLMRELGISTQTHISNLEKGRRGPSLQTVFRLAAYFDVTVDYLLSDEIPVHSITPRRQSTARTSKLRQWSASKLRVLRAERGLSQIELKRRLDPIAQGYLSNLESGRQQPSVALLLRLANVLEVNVEELLQEEG